MKRCLLAGIAAVILYAGLWEPWNVCVSEHNVIIPNLPKSLDGLRIVQLSDLHRGYLTRDNIIKKAVEAANSTHADIVILTGDFVSYSAANAGPCAKMLSRINAHIGSFAVMGNHDYSNGGSQVRTALEKCGIRMLVNSHADIGKKCYLVGIDDYTLGQPDIITAFRGIDTRTPCIILSHDPTVANVLSHQNGLLLSGHTHGGQIRIPFLFSRSAHREVDERLAEGWYKNGRLQIYINRGIGMTNLPLRLACRPEVSLFVLHSGR